MSRAPNVFWSHEEAFQQLKKKGGQDNDGQDDDKRGDDDNDQVMEEFDPYDEWFDTCKSTIANAITTDDGFTETVMYDIFPGDSSEMKTSFRRISQIACARRELANVLSGDLVVEVLRAVWEGDRFRGYANQEELKEFLQTDNENMRVFWSDQFKDKAYEYEIWSAFVERLYYADKNGLADTCALLSEKSGSDVRQDIVALFDLLE